MLEWVGLKLVENWWVGVYRLEELRVLTNDLQRHCGSLRQNRHFG